MKLETLLGALPNYLPAGDRILIERAYRVAEKAHAQQQRASGEPYVQHCLNVAYSLAELHMPTSWSNLRQGYLRASFVHWIARLMSMPGTTG